MPRPLRQNQAPGMGHVRVTAPRIYETFGGLERIGGAVGYEPIRPGGMQMERPIIEEVLVKGQKPPEAANDPRYGKLSNSGFEQLAKFLLRGGSISLLAYLVKEGIDKIDDIFDPIVERQKKIKEADARIKVHESVNRKGEKTRLTPEDIWGENSTEVGWEMFDRGKYPMEHIHVTAPRIRAKVPTVLRPGVKFSVEFRPGMGEPAPDLEPLPDLEPAPEPDQVPEDWPEPANDPEYEPEPKTRPGVVPWWDPLNPQEPANDPIYEPRPDYPPVYIPVEPNVPVEPDYEEIAEPEEDRPGEEESPSEDQEADPRPERTPDELSPPDPWWKPYIKPTEWPNPHNQPGHNVPPDEGPAINPTPQPEPLPGPAQGIKGGIAVKLVPGGAMQIEFYEPRARHDEAHKRRHDRKKEDVHLYRIGLFLINRTYGTWTEVMEVYDAMVDNMYILDDNGNEVSLGSFSPDEQREILDEIHRSRGWNDVRIDWEGFMMDIAVNEATDYAIGKASQLKAQALIDMGKLPTGG